MSIFKPLVFDHLFAAVNRFQEVLERDPLHDGGPNAGKREHVGRNVF